MQAKLFINKSFLMFPHNWSSFNPHPTSFFFLLLEILFFCIFYVYCFLFSFFSLVAYNYVLLTSSVLSLSIYMTMLRPEATILLSIFHIDEWVVCYCTCYISGSLPIVYSLFFSLLIFSLFFYGFCLFIYFLYPYFIVILVGIKSLSSLCNYYL